MSNTKHLIITERPGTAIEVITVSDRPAIIVTDGGSGRMAYFAPEKAPAIALAILEAAGVEVAGFESANYAQIAVGNLRTYVDEMEHCAKEAADREALEGEAFTLYSNAPYTCNVSTFAGLSEQAKIQWVAIARTARELHGGTK